MCVALLCLLGSSLAPAAHAAPAEALHAIPFRIHASLIDDQAGRDLAYWQAELADALAVATNALQGFHGPVDNPCCTRIESAPALETYGMIGDGFDVVLDEADFNAIRSFGPGAYLVATVDFCGGSTGTGIVGCATSPGDFLVVEVDDPPSLGADRGITIAHERGHNAGLGHPTHDPCELMAAANGGGCLTSSACDAFLTKAGGATGDPCPCLSDTAGAPPLADGTACSDPSGCGLCSGGLCGACLTSEAGSTVLSSGFRDEDGEATADNALAISGLTGGWTDRGDLGAELHGLAYDPTRDTVFGIGPQAAANDHLVKLDPATGFLLETVGTLDRTGLEALAYDSDADRLLAIEVGGELFDNPDQCSPEPPDCVSTLLEIHPDTAAVTELGALNSYLIQGGVQGLAYDASTQTLFGSSAAGLVTINRATCNGSSCSGTGPISTPLVRPSSLAFEPFSQRLLRVGADRGTTPVYQTFDTGTGSSADPDTGAQAFSIAIDGITPGGLAAIPVPEPPPTLLHATALAAITTLTLIPRRRQEHGRRDRTRDRR